MGANLSTILKLLKKLMNLEENISNEIKKEKDAKRRAKLEKAYEARDCDTISDMWFNPD